MTRKSQLGRASGGLYVILFFVVIPVLISIDPDYVVSNKGWSPMSQLGVSPETSLYYNLVQALGGFLIYVFYFYNFQERKKYYTLSNWDKSIRLGKLAVFGQVTMGIFANIEALHTYHLLAGVFFFAGVAMSLFAISIQFWYTNTPELKILTRWAYFIMFLGFLYPIYFRYTQFKGLWQFMLLASIMFWYILEDRIYFTQIETKIITLEMRENPNYNATKLLGITAGFLLIVISLVMLYLPSFEPANCGTFSEPKQCSSADNYISLIGGIFLTSISFNSLKHSKK